MRPYKQCTCGRSYSWEQWQALPCLGIADGAGVLLDLRDCTCDSTMAVELGPATLSASMPDDPHLQSLALTCEALMRARYSPETLDRREL